jgi:tRNA(Ile)-lysidine synthase
LCAEAAGWADVLAGADLRRVATERPDVLNIAALDSLNEARRRNVLRYWFRQLSLPSPAAVHLQQILDEVIAVPVDCQPRVQWPGCEVRRYRGRLYTMPPLPAPDPEQVYPLDLMQSKLDIAGIGCLRWRRVLGQGIRLAELVNVAWTVRFRRGGERFRPQGRAHRRELKKLLQEAGIPPWERERLPLIYAGEQLVAVIGLGIGSELAAREDEVGLVVGLGDSYDTPATAFQPEFYR